jgi:hypothetical protein
MWAVIMLGFLLKVPIAFLLWVLWKGFRLFDEAEPPPPVRTRTHMLCGYCGHRIAVGYDAELVHVEAVKVAQSTGQAAFDVETRLIRAEFGQPDSFPVEPTRCPGCGENSVWVAIPALDPVTSAALDDVRGRLN